MNPNKALWEKGDFTRIARSIRESGEELVKGLGITPGMRVLDLGCGDGTTALPAARLGAAVLGVDIASNLVEAGNQRAKAEGLTECRFQEGDASDLVDLGDESFDLTVSIFGAMFAPKPFDVAKEMFRVTRPGGRIVMGNWIPNDPTLVAQILKIDRGLFTAPARRVRQSDDLGHGGQRDSTVYSRRCSSGQHLVRPGYVSFHLPKSPGRSRGRVPQLLRAHHERVRRGRGQRAHRRTRLRARRPFQRAKRQPQPGHHIDPGSVPPRHRDSLKRRSRSHHSAVPPA